MVFVFGTVNDSFKARETIDKFALVVVFSLFEKVWNYFGYLLIQPIVDGLFLINELFCELFILLYLSLFLISLLLCLFLSSQQHHLFRIEFLLQIHRGEKVQLY